ncbi:RecX family transcriptional regulator [Limobrevibacterium gyesilva]|uniref:Regulatory protein RecX n=1 Tax=Limobrevibacterium gyesilva TaxID=2991712 RepID=A0AA42CG16_9PROT|nr:RecX family transcriptional regulator [Limobrevibacterium gyesilva]MCW3473375.1 RecX family transcriptional regulator [Limobrevibacterium gyesilva]
MTETHPGPPTEAALHEAALAHLARYATTQAGLVRVLDRRVDRWARAAASPDPDAVLAAKRAVRAVVARLAAAGVVNDAAFAESRARSLTRSGRSRRAVAAHLAARGVAAETVARAVPGDAETELAAALSFARRRRIGPFRRMCDDEAAMADIHRRELGVLARAGFPQDVASRALRMAEDEAEALVNRLRQS